MTRLNQAYARAYNRWTEVPFLFGENLELWQRFELTIAIGGLEPLSGLQRLKTSLR